MKVFFFVSMGTALLFSTTVKPKKLNLALS